MQHQFHSRCTIFLCVFFLSVFSAYTQQKTETNPLLFIENRGQIVDTDGKPRPDIAYVVFSGKVHLYFTSSGVSYVFVQSQEHRSIDVPARKNPSVLAGRDVERTVNTWRVDMELIGMQKGARIVPEEQTAEYFNYYYAHCPNGITGVPSYRRLVYSNVYNNIDMVFYENGQTLKYDFVVRPGGRVSDIRFQYKGADRARLTSGGTLAIATPLGGLEEYAPVSYQRTVGGMASSVLSANAGKPVMSKFVSFINGFGFDIGAYDPTQTLVVDPEVQWSTFLGGSGDDGAGHTIAVDRDNNIVVRGETSSNNFPVTAGALQTNKANGYDGFIAKFTNDGQRIWTTYYGGNGNDSDRKLGGITVDRENNILLAGTTSSNDFPVSAGSFQSSYGGGNSDAYIVKLTETGQRVWSTFFGGNDYDRAYSVATDSEGNVIVSGETASQNLPVSDGAFQGEYGGALSDAFIVKLDANGQRLWGTYYGGGIRYYELGFDVAIDSKDNILVAGMTGSADFPVSMGAFQTTYAGNDFDAFLVKMDAGGNRLWATFYGGRYTDEAIGVAIDQNDNVFMVGNSRSADFPVTNDAFQRQLANAEDTYDAIIVKFDAEGRRRWSTYYGGNGSDVASKIRVGANGELYLCGLTTSNNFPLTTDAIQQQNKGNIDCFIVTMSNDGQQLWSTYYGGSQEDEAKGITLDQNENIIISGHTNSSDFPIFGNAFQKQYGGGEADAFIVKFGVCSIAAPRITASGSTTFCAGDSVTLDAGEGYVSYLWSTGQTTRRIVVRTAGSYWVSVTNTTGCNATSATTAVVVEPCESIQCEALSGVINTYSVVSTVESSTATLTVTNPALFEAGAQVLLVQMQGASIDTSNTENYGVVHNLNGAGNYEFAVVREVRGNTLTLTAPLVHTDYDVAGHIQLVRVPQYDHAIVVDTLTCAPWNGETGGVLAFGANCLILDGEVDVSGRGFRGAVYEDQPGSVTQPHYGHYVSNNGYYWAMKGEGIAGNGVTPFIYGKGSPANGGGGGNNHNAGGGGGAGYGSGGIGGYGYQGVPGSFKLPQGIGGKGLATMYNRTAGRLFVGGGGGSGHINHAHGSQGASGGGMAFIRAYRLRSNGSHSMAARGNDAPHDSSMSNPDGCGGGGAGGSIFLDVATVENEVLLDVSGGNGGSRINSLTSSGPGGGGGGGMIVLAGDTNQFAHLVTILDGGAAGMEPGGKNYGAEAGQPGGRLSAVVAAGRMKLSEMTDCKGCMPVVQQEDRLCGKTLLVLSDAGEPITNISLDETESRNVVLSILGSLPSARIVIEVSLQEELQAGRYFLTVRNGSGREIAVQGEVYPLPATPVISFDGKVLSSTPAKQYRWYYSGNLLYNGREQTYRPSLSGRYTVKTTDENGCTAESEPFTVLLTSVPEESNEKVLLQPNPVRDQLTVRVSGVEQRRLAMDIRTILGVVVITFPVQTVTGVYEQTINVEHLPAGVYFLSSSNGREYIVREFMRN